MVTAAAFSVAQAFMPGIANHTQTWLAPLGAAAPRNNAPKGAKANNHATVVPGINAWAT
jgi:hypothetical protein